MSSSPARHGSTSRSSPVRTSSVAVLPSPGREIRTPRVSRTAIGTVARSDVSRPGPCRGLGRVISCRNREGNDVRDLEAIWGTHTGALHARLPSLVDRSLDRAHDLAELAYQAVLSGSVLTGGLRRSVRCRSNPGTSAR